jgi:hypothetical protein
VISQRAVDAIISFEVSSRAYYEKYYTHPEWPQGRSGVTIAIGYDLGFTEPAELSADWKGRVPDAELNIMQRCLGVKGEAAHALLPQVKSQIVVPWDIAMAVFLDRDVPKWTSAVCTAIPGADKLKPDCLGALVSLAYNRGASFNQPGDRYTEMRQIKAHVMAGQLTAVAGDIRTMKRLWPAGSGLAQRREAEARLWEHGLDPKNASQPLPDVPHSPTEKPNPAIPHKPTGGHGTMIAGLLATIVAVRQWGIHHRGAAILAIVGIGCAIGLFLVVRNARQTPVLANEKDRP